VLRYSLPDSRGRNIKFEYSIDTFSQVNFGQNRVLSAYFLKSLSAISAKRILDIYCGNGNFSLQAATSAAEVIGIEASEKSVALARQNALSAGIDNARFFSGDAERSFNALAVSGNKFDLLILDPPRSGAQNLAKKLCQVDPSYVIYVSCDPVTLARDLATLQKTGFRVNHIQPVDMFPQTYHIESIALLERI
jgi:23S rRNA (uracil1939-C5)-methyltransferase